MNRNAAILGLLAVSAPLAHAVEGFENVPALFSGGTWAQSNLSNPVGLENPWGQGDASQFAAATGAANSYIAANYAAVDDMGTISAWLFAPTQTFRNGDRVQFLTRSFDATPDRLQVRFSGNGAGTNVGGDSTSVGTYTTLLADINPSLASGGYPVGWTAYDLTISGLSGATSGRVGFRYFVTNGGASGANSNLIGVDAYNVQAVPEPTTLAALGLGVLALARRRRSAR